MLEGFAGRGEFIPPSENVDVVLIERFDPDLDGEETGEFGKVREDVGESCSLGGGVEGDGLRFAGRSRRQGSIARGEVEVLRPLSREREVEFRTVDHVLPAGVEDAEADAGGCVPSRCWRIA